MTVWKTNNNKEKGTSILGKFVHLPKYTRLIKPNQIHFLRWLKEM